MPRLSQSTRPAALSFAMWCEIVGCPRPRLAVKSQMQIGASDFQSEASIVRRVGSAIAFSSSDVSFAQVSLTAGSSNDSPRCLRTGSTLIATGAMIRNPSTFVDGCVRINPSTFIDCKEPRS
jgi:hypothetical protein